MATFTTKLGLRKPATTDVVNVTTDISDSMDTIDSEIGLEMRTSYPSSPYIGKMVTRTDLSNRTFFWEGTTWRELLVVGSLPNSVEVSNSDQHDVTATSYSSFGGNISTTFTCPASGKVSVTITAALEAFSPSSIWCGWEIRETNVAGAVVVAADDDRAVSQQEDKFHGGSVVSLVTGLDPSKTYFIRSLARVSANIGTVFNKTLFIRPEIT